MEYKLDDAQFQSLLREIQNVRMVLSQLANAVEHVAAAMESASSREDK